MSGSRPATLRSAGMIKVRHLMDRAAKRAGYDVIGRQHSTKTVTALPRTLALAGDIRTVVDIGASDGRWSRGLFEELPSADYLLFEANKVHYRALRQFTALHPNVKVEHAAASDHEGEIHFYLDDANPLGGGASTEAFSKHSTVVPCLPVDEAVERHSLDGPYLLKLDTQGHEIQILAGAKKTVEQSGLIVIEVYAIDEPGRPAFDEICQYMRTLGFKAAGIADVLIRPADGAWWQADMHFVRSDHPLFTDTEYH